MSNHISADCQETTKNVQVKKITLSMANHLKLKISSFLIFPNETLINYSALYCRFYNICIKISSNDKIPSK